MDVLRDLVSLVGVATIGTGIIILISYLLHGCRKLCKIVRDYKRMNEESSYAFPLCHVNAEIKRLKDRVYKAERNASNANFKIDMHVKNNKHTLTPYAKKLSMEREEIAKEDNHDRDICGCGDGM